jgi:hypothetical protein
MSKKIVAEAMMMVWKLRAQASAIKAQPAAPAKAR